MTEMRAPFPGTDAETHIQWKGTTVCMDFYCPCGVHGHIDAAFAYNVRCAACGAVYELGTQVLARRLAEGEVPAGEPVDAIDHFADAIDQRQSPPTVAEIQAGDELTMWMVEDGRGWPTS